MIFFFYIFLLHNLVSRKRFGGRAALAKPAPVAVAKEQSQQQEDAPEPSEESPVASPVLRPGRSRFAFKRNSSN